MSISKGLKYALMFAAALYVNISLNYPYANFNVPFAVDVVFVFANLLLGTMIMCSLNENQHATWWCISIGAVIGTVVYAAVWQTLKLLLSYILTAWPMLIAGIANTFSLTLLIGLYSPLIFLINCFLSKEKPTLLIREIRAKKSSKIFIKVLIGILLLTLVISFGIQVYAAEAFPFVSDLRYLNISHLFIRILSVAIVMTTVLLMDSDNLREKRRFILTKNVRYFGFFALSSIINSLICIVIERFFETIDVGIILAFLNFSLGILMLKLTQRSLKNNWIRFSISLIFGTAIYAVIENVSYTLTVFANPIANEPILLLIATLRNMLLSGAAIVLFYLISCCSFEEKPFPLKTNKNFIINLIGVFTISIINTFAINACMLRTIPSGLVGDFGRIAGWRYLDFLIMLRQLLPLISIIVTVMWMEMRPFAEKKTK